MAARCVDCESCTYFGLWLILTEPFTEARGWQRLKRNCRPCQSGEDFHFITGSRGCRRLEEQFSEEASYAPEPFRSNQE
jgi:hypothetical protein